MNSFLDKVYIGTGWFSKMVYLQLIFILFTIAGLGILGIFPASAALFAIVRQWLRGTTDQNIFKAYLSYYRQYFIKGNLLGFFLVILTSALCLYVYWLSQIDHLVANTLIFFIFFVLFFVLILWLFWLPILVHYNLIGFKNFKFALLIGLMRPLHTILLIVYAIIIYYWSRLVPGLLPLVNVTLLAIGCMAIASNAFKKFDEKI